MEGDRYPLLKGQFSGQQIRQLIANQANLPRYLGTYGHQQIISRITLDQVRFLRINYQSIITHLNRQNININNYSVHLLTTLHLYYRTLGMPLQAKETLKKTIVYLDNSHCDPVMQGICLNYLANLYKSKGKIWKTLKYSLHGVQILSKYFSESKSLAKKEKQQVATLLVVLLIYSKNALSRIIKQNNNRYIGDWFDYVNHIGYKICIKYLGKKSVFNEFIQTQISFHLPVFKTQFSNKTQKKENSKQTQIITQLQKIHQILKSKKNPEFVVINTSNISEHRMGELSEQSIFINNEIKEVIIQQKPQIPPPPPEPPTPIVDKKEEKQQPPNIIEQLFKPFAKEPQISTPKITINQQSIDHAASHHYVPSEDEAEQSEDGSLPTVIMASETICLNRWEINFKLQKQHNQRLGNLLIESSNKRKNLKEVITEQKLEKILCQINKEDKLSYQIINEEFFQEEFIEYYIKPFISISEQGKVAIHPHSTGLIQPFQIKFLRQDSLVFFNHIRHNLFRVVIAPSYSCKSIYLNMQLSQATILEYFNFEQEIVELINAVFKSINNSPAHNVPLKIKDKNRLCKVTNHESLLKYINAIIAEFEVSVLTRDDETAVNEIIENELFYYKYEEIKKNKLGIYYFIRYLPSINYLDVYLKNNYQTYSIDGKIKSRGNALYKAQDFIKDFGIPLKASKNNLFAYLEIIAKKYYLLTFDKPITEHDNDRYIENAILDLPITENCFRSKLFEKDGYFIPITISLLTINSETPVGMKIIEYDPLTCKSRGFFIHIVPNEWVRPYRRPVITINNVLFQSYINEFPFRNEYFLPEWLQKNGFSAIFDKIMDPSSQLCLEHNINSLVSGKILIKIFNNEDSI